MSKIIPVNEMISAQLVKLPENATAKFRDSVWPIYGSSKKGHPEHIGSCITLHIGGNPYLLTAAHVIDHNHQTTLYVGHPNLHPMSMNFYIASKQANGRDSLDFAIAKLSQSDVEHLQNAKFISEDEIDKSVADFTLGQTFTAIGYPNSKNNRYNSQRKKIKSQASVYTSIGAWNIDLAQSCNFSKNHHIMISRNNKYAQNTDFEKVRTTALRGMSGGAIINIGDFGNPEIIAGSEKPSPLLAGMLIEYHKNYHIIVAVKMTAIMKVIRSI